MPFIFLGLFVLVIGFLCFRWSGKNGSHEMRNGSMALMLAGFFLLLWGVALILTGNFAFNV